MANLSYLNDDCLGVKKVCTLLVKENNGCTAFVNKLTQMKNKTNKSCGIFLIKQLSLFIDANKDSILNALMKKLKKFCQKTVKEKHINT